MLLLSSLGHAHVELLPFVLNSGKTRIEKLSPLFIGRKLVEYSSQPRLQMSLIILLVIGRRAVCNFLLSKLHACEPGKMYLFIE